MGLQVNINNTTEDIQEIAANAWDELGLPSSASSDLIISMYRQICLKRALGLEANCSNTFYKKAVAYRFLCSIPLERKEYKATDILPTLFSMDASPDDVNSVAHKLRACAMLDVSISCMERAQNQRQLPYVNYVINVHYCMRKHVVRRRYSEFKLLHEALLHKLPVIPNVRNEAYTVHSMTHLYI
jgi:hypothetical protein